MTRLSVTLKEWQTLGPEQESVLAGPVFGVEDNGRAVARRLTESGRLEVLELARGLELRATSFVGRFRLGTIDVTINPKLTGAPLLRLLRYAYGLRHLDLYEPAGYTAEQWNFQDLIIRQLATEVAEILARGIHRDYIPVAGHLMSPRGQIDFNRHVRDFPWTNATLPCRYHPRIEDCVLNQVLLAGLQYAASLTADTELRGQLNRLRKALSSDVTEKRLDRQLLAEGMRALDRRTTAYKSILRILKLLLDSNGISLDGEDEPVILPGFLFDMNRFFQALLSRFLREHLLEGVLHDEYALRTLYSYAPGSPRGRGVPTPRPDFVIMRGGTMAAVLDAKYRDIWNQGLPREMLYQLSVYALGRTGTDRSSVILYPCLDAFPKEQVLCINDIMRGSVQGKVVLRPVNLLTMENLIGQGRSGMKERLAVAEWLVYGA